ncbi:hypothetical protein H634G_11608, partial [Metarhizium anisopliae BRIP 53293]
TIILPVWVTGRQRILATCTAGLLVAPSYQYLPVWVTGRQRILATCAAGLLVAPSYQYLSDEDYWHPSGGKL